MDTQLQTAEDRPSTVDIASTVTIIKSLTTITTDKDFEDVGRAWRVLRGKCDAIREWFKPRKAKAKAVHDQMCADERQLLNPVQGAVEHAARLMSEFSREKERQARLNAIAEAQRATKAEEARLLDEAAVMNEAGLAMNDPEMQFKAQEMVARASEPGAIAVPVQPRQNLPTVPGVKMKPTRKPLVRDKRSVVQAALAHPEMLDLVDINMSAARKYVDLYGDRVSTVIPGLTFEEDHKPTKGR